MKRKTQSALADSVAAALAAGNAGIVNASTDATGTKQGKADANKGTAAFSPQAFGKQMAREYLASIEQGTVNWTSSVVWLLRHCNDKARDNAMLAATHVRKACEDVTAGQSLAKRIADTRRVFAFAKKDWKATCELMEGKGGWHGKIASLPKVATTGRKKGQGKGKSSVKDLSKAIAAKLGIGDKPNKEQKAQVTALADFVQKKAKAAAAEAKKQAESDAGERIAKPDMGIIIGEIKGMNADQLRTVLDVTLHHLTLAKGRMSDTAKAMQKVLDEHDKAEATTLEKQAAA